MDLPVVREEGVLVQFDLTILLDLVLDEGDCTGNSISYNVLVDLTATNENLNFQ